MRKIPWKEMATHSSILAWENPLDRGAWWAIVPGVTNTWTRLKQLNTYKIYYKMFLLSWKVSSKIGVISSFNIWKNLSMGMGLSLEFSL